MKTKDLIEMLRRYPEDMDVVLNGDKKWFVERLAIYENYAERKGLYLGESLPSSKGAFKVLVIE